MSSGLDGRSARPDVPYCSVVVEVAQVRETGRDSFDEAPLPHRFGVDPADPCEVLGALANQASGVSREEWCVRRWMREVYRWCMSRTNIDIDDELCQKVMDRYHLATKREAVNMALRHLAGEPLGLVEARALKGSGWDADLDEMRTSRV